MISSEAARAAWTCDLHFREAGFSGILHGRSELEEQPRTGRLVVLPDTRRTQAVAVWSVATFLRGTLV